MDFRLSAEQELLRDSARRYFAAEGSWDKRASDDWARFVEFGWLAMPVPEAAGGLGAAQEDIAILCEEMGRGLACAPFIGSALLPARIVARCASHELGQTLLSSLAENSTRLAVAVYEPHRRYDMQPRLRAVAMPDGSFHLSGSKTLVVGGAQADQLIVTACIERAGHAAQNLALFVVRADQPGLSRRSYETLDGVCTADFDFDEVAVSPAGLLLDADTAREILEDALDEATLCLCAETLGCMDQAIELTASYLKLRKQFGKPLAEFQVLQHAVAEMSIDANSARSMVYRAMSAMAAPRRERQRAISGCFIKVMQAAKSVTGAAVHLHGGIGMSCEYMVGHFLRRVLVSERRFGDREFHLARYLG